MESDDYPKSKADGVDISSLHFQRFVCVQPPSTDKTWAVTYDEGDVYIIYGKTGTNLNFYKKSFSSRHEAEQFVVKKVREKERKGYSTTGFMSVVPHELNFATS